MADLISFDIDGTLEVGEPRGSITMDLVRAAQRNGCIIGSCSDRPLSYQKQLWEKHRIAADFTVLKQNLDDAKEQFQADNYTHVGDSDADEFFAEKAGFRFIRVDTMECVEWRDSILRRGSEE